MAVRYAVGDRDERPWGSWEVIATGPAYTVKRIMVAPGGRLSLQRHRHRSEHWILVDGKGMVTLDGTEREVAANEHLFIPRGAAHRIANTGPDPLLFIEVQTGEHLDEDDIERIEDDYARV